MRRLVLVIGLLCFVSIFLFDDAQGALESSSLNLSGDLSFTNNNDYTYTLEPSSVFSGSDASYLSFTTTGDYTGRVYNAIMELGNIPEGHNILINYDISDVDTTLFPNTWKYSFGYNIGAYATLNFYSNNDETVTFSKTYTGNYFADHSILTDPYGNTYSIWGNDFSEISFNHIAGQNYTYFYQVAYALGGGNQAWDSHYTLDIQTTPVPIPSSIYLLGSVLLGLVGFKGIKINGR